MPSLEGSPGGAIIDLHCHIEGSIDPDLAFDILRPEARGSAEARKRFRRDIRCFPTRYPDFAAAIHRLERCMVDHAAVVRVVADIVARAAAAGVKIFEPTFAPGAFRGADPVRSVEPLTEAVIEGVAQGARGRDIAVGLRMLVVSRHLTDDFRSVHGEIWRHALDYRRHLVGVDICGLDRMTPEFRERYGRHPVEWDFDWLRDACGRLRDGGLRLTAHAGEFASATPVRWALDLGAERIGHGVWAAQDPDLQAELIERQVTLEVCPTSNYRTGAVAAGETHPLKRLLDAGVPVTINTDDPAVQGSGWREEYAFARDRLGLDDADIRRCVRQAWRASFLPPADKARMAAYFDGP